MPTSAHPYRMELRNLFNEIAIREIKVPYGIIIYHTCACRMPCTMLCMCMYRHAEYMYIRPLVHVHAEYLEVRVAKSLRIADLRNVRMFKFVQRMENSPSTGAAQTRKQRKLSPTKFKCYIRYDAGVECSTECVWQIVCLECHC